MSTTPLTPPPDRVNSSQAIQMTRQRVTVILAISLLIAVLVLPVVAVFNWLSSRPPWCLSARNSADGVIVEVYRGRHGEPTYSTLLKGRTILSDIEQLTRQQLPAEIGTTTFSDETIRPGRWTLVLGGAKLDIMERAMILDDGSELLPNE